MRTEMIDNFGVLAFHGSIYTDGYRGLLPTLHGFMASQFLCHRFSMAEPLRSLREEEE